MKTNWITFFRSFVSESKWQKQSTKNQPINTLKPLLSKGFAILSFLSGKIIFSHFWVFFVPHLYLYKKSADYTVDLKNKMTQNVTKCLKMT